MLQSRISTLVKKIIQSVFNINKKKETKITKHGRDLESNPRQPSEKEGIVTETDILVTGNWMLTRILRLDLSK